MSRHTVQPVGDLTADGNHRCVRIAANFVPLIDANNWLHIDLSCPPTPSLTPAVRMPGLQGVGGVLAGSCVMQSTLRDANDR